ncbi:HI1506-related protein [Alishewanella jeotgali]|uniref:Mu-like prophage FluMu N-terminal domain-containing protein n=1 Tax=Alishewanella jeotgali KCTC 22429 TaxID=1129374 RepID=H3ZIF2_9ALTE|nr:HI1506-related protein [Alishewanella jeotgali]EHR39602.1 hypothetical protein AJE_15814 [Alishewanella jeotgali KCTC 22429]
MAKLLFIMCAAHTGYRRGGVRFTKGQNTIDAEKLSAEQLEQINNDPLLVVGEFADPSLLASLDKPAAKSLLPETNQGSDTQGGLGDGALSATVNQDKVLTLEQAIALLEPGNKDHFTNGGLPQLDALEKLVGRKVTGQERSDAWTAYQANLAGNTGAQQ